MSLYANPRGLLAYQSEDTARARRMGRAVFGWDTGMGKTHGLLALACGLLDDGEIDAVLLVCEQNKLDEWGADLEAFTGATVRRHYGPGRLEALVRFGVPQVLLTTYETARADAVEQDFDEEFDGPLTAALAPLRVLVAYDEMPKLAQAASGLYQAHRYLLGRLEEVRVAGLTATPLTRDWDSVYNMFRLICPEVLPTRGAFEELCVARRDPYKTIFIESRIEEYLLRPIAPFLLRRRKTDPDTAPLFPEMVEHVVHTDMTPDQREVYAAVERLGDKAGDGGEVDGVWLALRLLAAYPAALADIAERGNSGLVAEIVGAVGAAHLRSIRPGKLDALLDLLRPVADDGEKAVVFTFFGPTVLPLLARDLAPLGVEMFVHYGEMGARPRSAAISGFRAHSGPAVLLSSDAGSRGINLPEARHVVEYEGALTYMVGAQRRNRAHRLDSKHASVHCTTLIADGTVEEPIASVMLRRNGQTDVLLGDDVDASSGFTSAGARRSMMALWKPRAAV